MTDTLFMVIYPSLYFQIERSIERNLGTKVLDMFKEYVRIKEQLIGERKELGDKIKLSRRQMMELEVVNWMIFKYSGIFLYLKAQNMVT